MEVYIPVKMIPSDIPFKGEIFIGIVEKSYEEAENALKNQYPYLVGNSQVGYSRNYNLGFRNTELFKIIKKEI